MDLSNNFILRHILRCRNGEIRRTFGHPVSTAANGKAVEFITCAHPPHLTCDCELRMLVSRIISSAVGHVVSGDTKYFDVILIGKVLRYYSRIRVLYISSRMHTIAELGTGVPAFLAKLWKLVEDPETDNLICWSPVNTFIYLPIHTRVCRRWFIYLALSSGSSDCETTRCHALSRVQFFVASYYNCDT